MVKLITRGFRLWWQRNLHNYEKIIDYYTLRYPSIMWYLLVFDAKRYRNSTLGCCDRIKYSFLSSIPSYDGKRIG
jgi:hypothetical protein